ncbi:energy-coupling factor ABC transporter ATP-binding protein [Aliiroseovarius marinus]|uniref:energy-coupling factor ABC transporter ATP-binding protein n=1 Tax=Aliiroseovarius marinus TaxID=2500159 RepID=UPI003D7EAE4E
MQNMTETKQKSADQIAARMTGVDLTLDGKPVLTDVSVTLAHPRIGVVGRNGSGKTSFSRVLCGLQAPTSGQIRIDGMDPAKNRKAALQVVGILFQNPDHQIIFPTVIEEVSFGLKQQGHDTPETAALDVLARFGKAHWKDAHIYSLSQGQKQLVCLMSILAMNPKLVILDEPFSGLDIPTRRQIQRFLDRYEGTLVHVSHDPRDLAEYDHIIWIDQGRLHEEGHPADILPRYEDAMNKIGEGDDISDLSS